MFHLNSRNFGKSNVSFEFQKFREFSDLLLTNTNVLLAINDMLLTNDEVFLQTINY